MTSSHSASASPKRSFKSNQTGPVTPASLLALAVLVSACGGGAAASPASGTASPSTVAAPTTTQPPVALTASEPSWQLRNPLSRMVLLPDGSGQLAILGGLTAADTSASGIFRLDLSNGSLTALGSLPAPVHDAAGAEIGSRYFVMGGGSTATVASVDAALVSGGSGSVVGSLPRPRSDCTAVSAGGQVIVAGGYDGSAADPSVLSTTDGRAFKKISTLKVPVRYTALAYLKGSVYAFGGMAVGGSGTGEPTSVVQKIDLATGVTTVVGSLPMSLEGAMAFVLNGHVYLAGGDTGSTSRPISNTKVWAYQPGAGFTQIATLPLGVAYAGLAISGGAAWLVGGEHNGKTTAVVQMLKG